MTTTADLERVFKAGTVAYHSGDYERAVTAFLKLSRTVNATYRTKAGMGLVRTYMAQQDWPRARAHCQKIRQSAAASVQQWAADTLITIDSHTVPPNDVPHTATVSVPSFSAPNLSGFQPIGPVSPASVTKLTVPAVPAVLAVPAVSGAAAPDKPVVSIFHYAYLNGEESPVQPAVEEPIVMAEQDSDLPAAPPGCGWAHTERLSKGRSLGKLKRGKLWIAQIAGAIALYALLIYLMRSAIALTNSCLQFVDQLLPVEIRQLPEFNGNRAWLPLGLLVALVVAAPWLWDFNLRLSAGRQAFSNQNLRVYSPEAAMLLRTHCHRRQWPFPTLWKLPTEVPLIFSYGWLPRNARLVISEGLLTQLEADEIAALVGYEVAHWGSGYWPLLSAQGLLLQLFHQIYWQLALWGNQQPKKLKLAAGVLVNLSYSLFWLIRLPALWIARLRTYYGDRTATELTGNPNGLARALLKLSSGLAASVERQQYTPAIIESVALLLPVSADLARYRLYGDLPLDQLFAWDSLNPMRSWMSFSDAQPPLGDRLTLLTAYAQHWQLDHPQMQTAVLSRRRQALSAQDWSGLIAQGTPFFGLIFGLIVGIGLWLVGALAIGFNQPALDWMYKDRGLFLCCLLMGFGIGNLLRINRFFPDLRSDMPPSNDLSQRLITPNLLPVSSLPTKLSGVLLGRPGLANWLGQDLLLKTSCGLLRLHFFSTVGPLGNALPRPTPIPLIGQSIQVQGWFRRGNQPWLDIDKIRASQQRSLQAAHPLFSLLLTVTTSGWGLWLLGLNQIIQALFDKITQ